VREEPGPEDSVSNAGSHDGSRTSQHSKTGSSSSGSSRLGSASALKARAAAKKAILEAEATSLAKFEALQREGLSLQMRKRALELQTEIEKAKAEELAYAKAAEYAERALLIPCGSFVAEKGTIPKLHTLSNQSEDRLKLTLQTSEALPVQSKETKTLRSDNFAATKEETKFGELMTQKGSTCKDEHSSAGTLFEWLMATQCQQNSTMQQLLQRQQESTLALTLPQHEVLTFGGDPTEYWGFIRAFENLIESKTTSDSARLYYLVQYIHPARFKNWC